MMRKDVILDQSEISSWNVVTTDDKELIRNILRSHNLLSADGDVLPAPAAAGASNDAAAESPAYTACIAACDAAAAKAERECEAIEDPAACIACAVAVRAAQQACYSTCPV